MDPKLLKALQTLKNPPPRPPVKHRVTRALTLQEPWLWAFQFAGKRVENRTWAPADEWIGKPIALHGGKLVDTESIGYLRECGFDPDPSQFGCGKIVMVGTLDRIVRVSAGPHDDPFLFGPVGLYFRDMKVLSRPVDAMGMLGLWPIPEDVQERVNAQL
jgi:hypothetical protein